MSIITNGASIMCFFVRIFPVKCTTKQKNTNTFFSQGTNNYEQLSPCAHFELQAHFAEVQAHIYNKTQGKAQLQNRAKTSAIPLVPDTKRLFFQTTCFHFTNYKQTSRYLHWCKTFLKCLHELVLLKCPTMCICYNVRKNRSWDNTVRVALGHTKYKKLRLMKRITT